MSSSNRTPQEYEQLGRAVTAVFESGYLDAKQSYKTSFFKGLFSGLGGAIGATLLLTLLLWILSLFSTTPLIGHFVKNIDQAIKSANK